MKEEGDRVIVQIWIDPHNGEGGGVSIDLMLYDDPWKIRKTLTMSDLGNLKRLMLHKEVVVNFVLLVLSPEARNEVVNENGTIISI